MATVVLVGTLDTKGDEYRYLRDRIAEQGCDVVLVDVGVLGLPRAAPDVSRQEVARAGGADVERLASDGDRGAAMEAMARGAAEIVSRLYAEGRLDAVLALGGSGGSSVATRAMRRLPVGVPKLMVSTLASGDTRPYVGESDVCMMYSVVDIAGLNRLSERILRNAAAAAAGMATASAAFQPTSGTRPIVSATMFGVTTPCVTTARELLEERGYEVLVFHATGTGGRSMEGLMASGYIAASLDITTTELADELVGGVLSAGPERLEAAGRLGLPQVVSLGALDMVNFGPFETVPDRFRSRNLYRHNAAVTLMRTTPEECEQLGAIVGRKLSGAQGPVTVFVPLRGLSMIDRPGGPFHDPEADRRLVDSLKRNLDPHVRVVEVDTDINDPAFAAAMVEELDRLCRQAAGAGGNADDA
jgi:uncharacterized protein (UPF0261 family)